jgi:hypothetical protein
MEGLTEEIWRPLSRNKSLLHTLHNTSRFSQEVDSR